MDFQTKLIELPQGTVKLSIWDVVGQDRFQTVRENFYRGANAVGFVYDLGNAQSLQNLVKWYKEVRMQLPVSKLIVVGNKADRFIEPNLMDRCLQKNQCGLSDYQCKNWTGS